MCLSSCRIFLIGTFSTQCNQYRIQFEQQPRRRKFKNRIGLNLLSWQLQYPLLFVFEIKYCSHDQTGRQALVNAGKSVNYDTKIEILNYINTLNILEYNLTIYVLLRLQKYNELMRSTFIRQIINISQLHIGIGKSTFGLLRTSYRYSIFELHYKRRPQE